MSVMDPVPYRSALGFLLPDVLVWGSEAAPVVWSSFMEASGWKLCNFWWKNLKFYMFWSSNPWIQIRIETNANPQHWLLRLMVNLWQNSGNGKFCSYRKAIKKYKNNVYRYVARDICIVVGILGAVSRWDSDHYLSSMYSWVTSYPTTAIVFLGKSS